MVKIQKLPSGQLVITIPKLLAEYEGLEKGMGHEMEHGRAIGGHAGAQKHISKLTDRGVGQNALDVVLGERDRCGKKRCQSADSRDDRKGNGRQRKEKVQARDHVDPGGDHGRRMDQGAHGGWALHGVGEPNMERDLR